jgi:hypothetical protein
MSELQRYMELESRAAAGEDPRVLLAEVDRELLDSGVNRGLFLAVRAELEQRLGRTEHAAQTARAAIEQLGMRARREPTMRAVIVLTRRRLASWGKPHDSLARSLPSAVSPYTNFPEGGANGCETRRGPLRPRAARVRPA